jgi:predicted phage-related endonuclease
MNESKWKTIADLALEKWSDPEVKEQNDAMMRGTILEPALLEFAAHIIGSQVRTPDEMFTNGRLIATLDGVTDKYETIVEAKTTTAYSCDDSLPAEYYWQALAQLACLPKAKEVRFVVLDKRMRLAMPPHWVVTRDQDNIDALMLQADNVGQALDARRLPDGVTFTEEIVKALYPSPIGAVELGFDGVALVDAYNAARSAREHCEQMEKTARDALVSRLGEFEAGTVDGNIVVTYKSRSTGSRLDTKQLELDYPDLVAQYKKPAGTTRVLKVVGE